MKVHKIGDKVYDKSKNCVAFKFRGAWYRKVASKENNEYDPVDVTLAETYDLLEDEGLQTTFYEGEQSILDTIMRPLVRCEEKMRSRVLADAERRVAEGMRMHGRFTPSVETRPFHQIAQRKVVDAMVYYAMAVVREGNLPHKQAVAYGHHMRRLAEAHEAVCETKK